MISYVRRESRLLLHQLVLVVVLGVLTAWRLLDGRWEFGISVLAWWLGAMLGFVFVFFDRIVYVFWQNPEDVLSLKLKELLARGKVGLGLATLLEERQQQERLIIRSFLFVVVWLLLAIFAVFSVGSYFGRGFILGLGLHLVMDVARDFWGKSMGGWFWQIKRQLTEQEIATMVWGFLILAVLLMLGL